MKVRVTKQLRGAHITANPGDVIETEHGEALVAAGAAEPVIEAAVEVAPVVEAAVASAEETATEPRPRGRRGGRTPAEE